ncbi:hypothetical protein [Bacteroides fragilis]|uniref:hypothetical protein n=1 Tax=Bacteroides fragilis TaxID=817 RepID=UPI00189F53FE|nr:hypothetical protein [Bacteroides fragilis]
MEKNNNRLVITSDVEVIDVRLCPNKTPLAYQRKLKELVEISGMTGDEAKTYLLRPIQLELLYDYGLGLFAVESEAIESTEIYNPYTGKEIPKEEEL